MWYHEQGECGQCRVTSAESRALRRPTKTFDPMRLAILSTIYLPVFHLNLRILLDENGYFAPTGRVSLTTSRTNCFARKEQKFATFVEKFN